MVTAEHYKNVFMKYYEEMKNRVPSTERKTEAKKSLMKAGLLNKDGSAKKRIVDR